MAGGSLPGTGSSGASAGRGNASITFTIPGGAAGSAAAVARRTPQTISSQTQSIAVSVNGGTPQIFNAASPTCTAGANGLTCTLVVGAPFGQDGFLLITYSGPGGTGTPLNAAAFTLDVTQGGANTASATAGNLIVVNSTADGSGSGFSCSGGTCTLREAVAEASTTAGVYTAIMFQGVTTITLSSPVEIGQHGAQNIILLGPGATVPSPGIGAPTASSNLTISGGGSTGILKVDAGNFLSVVGLTLANGSSSDGYGGGAIENDGGSLAIINAVFSGNTATAFGGGGAVYDNGAGSGSSIATSTFTSNTSEYGGAYYVESGSAGASFSHSLFNANTAFNASDPNGPYGEGGAIDTYGNVSVDSSTFTGNVAGSVTASGLEGDGGAIAIWNNTASPSVTNSTFGGSASQGNFAGGAGPSDYGYGGAIENDGSNPITLSGNTFAYNVSRGGYESYGGAVDDYLGVTSSGDTFSSNTADSSASSSNGYAYGGAIQTAGISSVTSDTFSANRALGGPPAATSGEAYGGAVYEDGYAFTASQTTFSNNTASAGYECDGGGAYVYDDSTDVIAFSSVQFTNNTCSSNETTFTPYAYGGGLEVDYAYVTLANVTFSGNTASAAGDGVSYVGYAYGGGFEYYEGQGSTCRLCSGAQRLPPSSSASRVSAAMGQKAKTIAADRARVTQDVARRQSSRSRRRAGKRLAAAPTVHRASGSMRRTLAVTPSSSLTNVTFSGNTANGGPGGHSYGGGADLSGAPSVSGVSFSSNAATVSGTGGYGVGGGFSNGGAGSCGTLTFAGTISANTASNEGGGIWNPGSCSLTLSASSVSSNQVTTVAMAGDGGGGIWNEGNLTVTQSTLGGNSVAPALAGTGGGAIFDYYGYPTITNSTVASNTSAQDGGGIELYNSYGASVVNDTVYGNQASGYGGNVYDLAATLAAQGNIVAGGSASSGGPDFAVDSTQFASNGYNLIATSFAFLNSGSYKGSTGDLIASGAPVLSQTTFTAGGVTMTIYAEQSSSTNTIDKIPFSVCQSAGITVDQRGSARGADGFCDIGSYEL